MVLISLTGRMLIATPTRSSLSSTSLTVTNDEAARHGARSFRSMMSTPPLTRFFWQRFFQRNPSADGLQVGSD